MRLFPFFSDCEGSWAADNLKVDVSDMMLTITGLQPAMTYNISLRAVIFRGDNSRIVSHQVTSKVIYSGKFII